MFARRRQLTKTSSDDEDDERIISQRAPGIAAPERGSKAALPAEQCDDHHTATSPLSGRERRSFRTHLTELLESTAALVAELDREEPATEPAHAAAILVDGWEEEPAKLEFPPKPQVEIPSPKHRLPFVKEFTAAGGDWEAFRRHFTANCELAGWTEAEALRVLPTALDDDALATFYAVPPAVRATLLLAFAQMAAIYDPSSNVRHKFTARRRREAETPLAFCSALLSLAKKQHFSRWSKQGLTR
ncbi:unnamed protein product [Lampetra planeri]